MNNLIHKCLSSVLETKRHAYELKKSEWSCDGDISGGDCNLMVGTHEIKFGENGGTL